MWWAELDAMAGELASAAPSIHPDALVDPAAMIDERSGPVRIGAGTIVCAGARIEGPVELGEDCLIGNLAFVRGPVRAGRGVRIGFAAEIKNALLADEVSIGPQCFVADSRLDRRAYLGAQVRTSNHLLDGRTVTVEWAGERRDSGREKLGCWIGEGAALGIQVVVLPGRIVAAGSLFGPRITIEKNLPAGRYRLAQTIERTRT
jgi:bifunctional UDP-N-acetylglucosamine pyrophosphorylase/glucosamine-1-phosphate N-acetyltransferase